MGSCLSCCCPDADAGGDKYHTAPGRGKGRLSEKDHVAQAKAAEAAAARQAEFDASAYGRAVKKGHENVAKERAADAARRADASAAGQARDWLS
mmetsp:Transcript_43947/g.112259  ORF Transcript_43947/g.112259 Transcript_43947/m.112259 type:complete len:94 (+) Transcript_43947:38-319(+)|eukprot:jgi/Tetstr1/465929/TSEL_010543.t1